MKKAALILAVLALVGCSSAPTTTRTPAPTPTPPAGALAMMEAAFEGNPRRSEIRDAIERAFEATNLPVTD